MSDGKRKITSICELESLSEGEIHLKEIFAFKQLGVTDKGEVNGEYILYNKQIPKVYRKIRARGIESITDMFPKE